MRGKDEMQKNGEWEGIKNQGKGRKVWKGL